MRPNVTVNYVWAVHVIMILIIRKGRNMAQNSTIKISLGVTEAKALYRYLSAGIEYIEGNPTRLLSGDKDILAGREASEKVFVKISKALEKQKRRGSPDDGRQVNKKR